MLRVYGATFVGAFVLALIYSTKPDGSSTVTLARSGDTALVIDTMGRTDSADVRALPAPGIGRAASDSAASLSAPAVIPTDLEALKNEHLVIPVAGVAAKDLVDSFDETRDGVRHHNAIDIMAARNTPVIAAVDGRVLKLHNSVAGGLTIYESDPSSRFVMMYGHLDSYRPGLTEGTLVRQGSLLGFVGSTGNANPLAPHLHFQITRNDNMSEWWKGTPINPFPLFRPQG
jgi:murein DD-endopeptidase MepM/ murein hydrolase activator NlpD